MKQKKVWQTSDGEMFDDDDMAYNHERYLIICKNLNKTAETLFGQLPVSRYDYKKLLDKFIASYEVIKYAVNQIEEELKNLNSEDEGENESESLAIYRENSKKTETTIGNTETS